MIQFQIHRLLAEVRAGERRVRKIMTMTIVTDDDSDDNGDKEDHFISSMQVSELEGILKRQGEEGYRTSIQEEVRNLCICI